MLTVTGLDTAGVALPLVVTSKVKEPEDGGAVAVRSSVTVSPLLTLQPFPSVTVNPPPGWSRWPGPAPGRYLPYRLFALLTSSRRRNCRSSSRAP